MSLYSQEGDQRINRKEYEELKKRILELEVANSKESSVVQSRGITNDEAGKNLSKAGFWNTVSIAAPIIGGVFIYSQAIQVDANDPNYSGVILASVGTGLITIGANVMVSISLFDAGQNLRSD